MLPAYAQKKTPPFFIILISFVLVVSACVTTSKKIPSLKMPISKSESCIKQHERIMVYAIRPPWTKTKITVSKDDKIIILASGIASTSTQHKRSQNLHPYNLLQMKIGKEGMPESALLVNNQRYFEPTEYGELMFAVHDWKSPDRINPERYLDNSGSYLVDVFVISKHKEKYLLRNLQELGLLNSKDKTFVSHVDQLIEIHRGLFFADVEVASSPENAQVYINSHYRGVTPTTLKALNKNDTYEICLKMNGYPDFCDEFSPKDTNRLFAKLKKKTKLLDRKPVSLAKETTIVSDDTGFGRYHALVIGNNNYRSLPKLKTAFNDAKVVAEILSKEYGFKVNLLLDSKRSDILLALGNFRRELTKKDNLLIYYAGHGWLDKQADEGYWLPIDADPDNDLNWISNSSVTAKLKAIEAKHVLVVADSCYSGKLGRGVHIINRSPSYFAKIAKKKARSVISSGGLEPVIDSGGKGNHSVFASAFIEALNENTDIMDGTQLFSKIRRPVMLHSDQTPEYSDIRKAGHDGGDFLFVRVNR